MQALRILDPLDPLQPGEKATSKNCLRTRVVLLAAPGSLRIGPGVLVAKSIRRENYNNHSFPEP